MPYTNKDLRKLIILLVLKQLLAIFVGMVDTINILVINITAALATSGAVVAGHYLKQKGTRNASKIEWQSLLSYAVFYDDDSHIFGGTLAFAACFLAGRACNYGNGIYIV